jgi:ArsR family transcriptional regulator, arsenate/arsenite/antimonite-responsive transcriptional repressor
MMEAEMIDEQMASVAKALSHPARIRIVRLLAAQAECAGHEVFAELPLAQSTVSEHLRVLREAGLLESRPVGTTMVYCLLAPVLEEFGQAIEDVAANAATCASGPGGC